MARCVRVVSVLLALVFFASACSASRMQAGNTLMIVQGGGNWDAARHMLKLDDFRKFENAELHFLMLRVKDRENVELAGWFAQLYVAWAEQLQSELNLLRIKLAAAAAKGDENERLAVWRLIDFRGAQLAEIRDSARLLCNVLVTYYANDYISHRVMADYYRLMGDRSSMQAELEQVRRLNPDSVGLLFIEGAALAQFVKDYERAIAFYDQALKKDPEFVKALYFKGLAQYKLGCLDEARQTMSAVLAASPGHPGAKRFFSVDAYLSEVKAEAMTRLADEDLPALAQAPRMVMAQAMHTGDTITVKVRLDCSACPAPGWVRLALAQDLSVLADVSLPVEPGKDGFIDIAYSLSAPQIASDGSLNLILQVQADVQPGADTPQATTLAIEQIPIGSGK
jgi:tetratricopeptide (TPR) repeat protein